MLMLMLMLMLILAPITKSVSSAKYQGKKVLYSLWEVDPLLRNCVKPD